MTTPAQASDAPDWSGVRLHVVTGKGGTGKTTTAAALALALASEGRTVLLVEVENRQGIAQVFDVPPLGYEPRKIANAPGGGTVMGMAVEAKAALLEYLQMFYKLGPAAKVLEKFGAVDFATTIAPGIRDVLLTGKCYEAVRRRDKGRPVYDAVVLDAPPTGRIVRFLNVNHEVSGLARVGPIRNQADSITTLLRSGETLVHLVTLLEEMPVQETADGVRELESVGLPVGAVVVNLVREAVLPVRRLAAAGKGDLDADQVSEGLAAAGLSATPEVVEGLLAEARDHADRLALEKRERVSVDRIGRPVLELPALAAGIDLGGLYLLAERLEEQGAA